MLARFLSGAWTVALAAALRESIARLIGIKGSIIPPEPIGSTMAVHTISLGGALLIILLAIVFLFLIGPVGLLILIVAAVLLWYAFGPGSRRVVIT